jgi:hypothetical protein
MTFYQEKAKLLREMGKYPTRIHGDPNRMIVFKSSIQFGFDRSNSSTNVYSKIFFLICGIVRNRI